MIRAALRILLVAFLGLLLPVLVCAEDINGIWHFDYGYNMTFTGSGESFTGSGAGNGYTWPVTNGVISGNSISWHESYDQITYTVDRVGTINGDSMSGTYTTGGGGGAGVPWSATRISGGAGPTPTPTPDSGSGKRLTASTIFCNREGVDLATAKCSVTVADQGPPPRILPTGTVNLSATGGFFPAAAECALQQVSFSPGVGSCEVQFTVPSGFSIGTAFPINSTYPENEIFRGSSTSHQLIEVSCVGVPGKTCPDSIGISYSGIPKLVDNLFSILAECGSGVSTSSALHPAARRQSRQIHKRDGLLVRGGNCKMTAALGLDLDRLLTDIPQVDLEALAQLYSNSPTKFKDAFLNYARDASQLEAGYYQALHQNQAATDEIQRYIEKNVLNENWTKLFSKYRGIGHLLLNARNSNPNKRKKLSLLKIAEATKEIKSDKTGVIKLRLNARMKKILPLLRQAGINTIPMKVVISVKQEKRKKKALVEDSVDVVL